MSRAWYERWPERLECELEALRARARDVTLDAAARREGRITITAGWPLDDGFVDLVIEYPGLFPYLRPEVKAPEWALGRHQNPFAKNLCLINRATSHWTPKLTAARLIEEQLPRLLEAVADEKQAEEFEDHQGEPITAFFEYYPESVVLIDSRWQPPEGVRSGNLRLRLQNGTSLASGLRAAVTMFSTKDVIVGEAAAPLGFEKEVAARWVRLDEPPGVADPTEILKLAEAVDPAVTTYQPIKGGWGPWTVTAVLFPEEVTWREKKVGWLFIVHQPRFERRRRMQERAYLARAARAGRGDMAARVRALQPLARRKIAVFGLGALGGPSTLEFARSGMRELRILDGDVVEAGTTVRWPSGLAVAGAWKALALQRFIQANYPWTGVVAYPYRLGVPGNLPPEEDVIAQMLDGVDLVYDATAEVGIQQALSSLALEAALPYICVWATHGGWGGGVARVLPAQRTGCWLCLQLRIRDYPDEMPPADPAGLSQPEGCASPTFQGASFDLVEVTLMGVRMAVATLCAGEQDGYPDFKDDVALLRMRDPKGGLIVPSWETWKLEHHPECPICGS